jgi:hypothetical protein
MPISKIGIVERRLHQTVEQLLHELPAPAMRHDNPLVLAQRQRAIQLGGLIHCGALVLRGM